VPKLQFIYDKTSIKGQALSSLIDRAVKEDSLHQHDDESSADDDNKGV
jgi:ribosome-binding factor A